MTALLLCLVLHAAPLSASENTSTLEKKINKILKRHHLDAAKLSIEIVSLKSQDVLFEKNAKKPLNPASVMKLLTSVAAFETFGSQYRYPTEIYTSASTLGEELPDLWIKGYGSPFLVKEELQWMAKALHDQGVRKISGPIYVDDSFFRDEGPVQLAGITGKSVYRVVTGALSYNFNRPESLLYAARTNRKQARLLRNTKLLDPAIYTGIHFKRHLSHVGIKVTENIDVKPVPSEATLLIHHRSQPLAEIMLGLNKFSNNFIAEQVLKSLGGARYGSPASEEKGLAVLAATLKRAGAEDLPVRFHNGSGLSRDNRISASALTLLLRHALLSPYGDAFTRSLSIAGVDGTLRRRFLKSSLKGKLWGKTGSLYQVSALAGYFLTKREPVAFAILINDYEADFGHIQRAEEKIVETVARELNKDSS